MKLRFGDCLLDTEASELIRDGAPVPVEPQVFDLLAMLVAERDRVVSKDELVEAVWNGRAVSDATITSRINLARQAVGDSGSAQAVIRTFPKRGFRFVADVETSAPLDLTRPPQATILVLPFKDLTAGGSDYLAEGLTEDLIVALSRFADVSVIAISTALKIGETSKRLENPLGLVEAHYLVTGTVRLATDTIRVTVQLADKGTGSTIWSERFDRPLQDVFAVLDEIVEALAGRLPRRVLTRESQRFKVGKTGQLSSYQAYLRALWDVGASSDIDEQIAELRAITARDPDFAPARAALGFVLAYRPLAKGQWRDSDIAESHHHAREAAKLAPDNDRVLADAGLALFISGAYAHGLNLGRRAMEINPNSTTCTHNYGTMLAASGDPQGGLACHHRTVALDPLFPEGHYEGMIEANFLHHRYDEAVALFEKWSVPRHHVLATGAASYAMAGDLATARTLATRFEQDKPDGFDTLVFVRAFLGGHQLQKDRAHWLQAFAAAGLPGVDTLTEVTAI